VTGTPSEDGEEEGHKTPWGERFLLHADRHDGGGDTIGEVLFLKRNKRRLEAEGKREGRQNGRRQDSRLLTNATGEGTARYHTRRGSKKRSRRNPDCHGKRLEVPVQVRMGAWGGRESHTRCMISWGREGLERAWIAARSKIVLKGALEHPTRACSGVGKSSNTTEETQ